MSAYPNDKLISVSHLPMVGKLLIGASIINGLVLLFDDIPSETQYKEFLLKKCLPRKVINCSVGSKVNENWFEETAYKGNVM